MSEKEKTKQVDRPHSLTFCNNLLTVNGVVQVVEVSAKEAQLKLSKQTLFVHGNGLNVVKLDREQGVVQLETESLSQLTYRTSGVGLKGLFR